jgi:hypothetical protein
VLLFPARRADAAHRAAHQKPISADTLRVRLGVGAVPGPSTRQDLPQRLDQRHDVVGKTGHVDRHRARSFPYRSGGDGQGERGST